jgi:hypothetical protein
MQAEIDGNQRKYRQGGILRENAFSAYNSRAFPFISGQFFRIPAFLFSS